MMHLRLLLCFSFLIVSCTSQTEKAKPVIQSITIMGLCSVDTITALNTGHGIGRYIHFDFANDSVFLYKKEYAKSEFQFFDRFKKDTLLANLKADTVLTNFASRLITYDFANFYKEGIKRAKRLHESEGDFAFRSCSSIRDFYVILKTDSTHQVFAYSYGLAVPEFRKATELFLLLTESKNLQNTNKKLNEDSLMAPVLTHPVISKIFILPAPPPPPPAI